MRLERIPPNRAIGSVLVHNISGPDGRKAFSKGHLVQAADVDKLNELGMETVYVAMLEQDDVREDQAVARIAHAVSGSGIERSKPSGGRVNLYASGSGVLQVNASSLRRVNELHGVTLATIADRTLVAARKMVATLKTIGLALPLASLERVASIVAEQGAVLQLAHITRTRVAIILTGSENGRARVQEMFAPSIRARVTEAGAQVMSEDFVPEKEESVASAINKAMQSGAQVIVLAGETSIMDAGDITPRGIEQAGGKVELYGAPVEPGNLLLLAYKDNTPIVGAPGCIKSRETNVVDLILPRLLAGEHVSRSDVIDLAVGGLLVG